MQEPNYSHDFINWLISVFPDMDYARLNEPLKWRLFTQAVANETANAYPQEWTTSWTINKMADDIGSYQLLVDIWAAVERVFAENVSGVLS